MPAAKLIAHEKRHQHQKAGAVERAVRRQQRGKQFRLWNVLLKFVACGHGVSVYPDHGQNHPQGAAQRRKPVRKASRRTRPAKPKPREESRPRPKPWTPAEVHEAFSRFRKANPGAEGRTRTPQSLHAAGGGGAVGAGDRRRRQQGDARAVCGRRHAAKDARARRGKSARLHQDHRPLSQQGQERHRAVGKADRRIRRRGAAHPRRDRVAAGRRAQDRQCRAQHGLWRAHHGGRHARVPRRQPHRARAGQDAAGGRTRTGEGDPVRIHAARASLADPARPLHLPRRESRAARCA